MLRLVFCLAAVALCCPSPTWAQTAPSDAPPTPPVEQAAPPIQGSANGATPPAEELVPIDPDEDIDAPVEAGPTGEIGTANGDLSQDAQSVIVRLDPHGELEGPFTVVLTGPDGEVYEATLNDSGEPPDVPAGDGLWAGIAENVPSTVTVVITTDSGTLDGGAIEWSETRHHRAVELSVKGGVVSATAKLDKGEATVPKDSKGSRKIRPPAVPNADGTLPQLPPTGPQSEPGQQAPGHQQTPGGQQPMSAVTHGGASSPFLWMILGAALTALLGAGLALWRGRLEGGGQFAAPPLPPPRVPEAGLLGPGTPAVSEGLSVWTCATPHDALQALLATLSDGRQVVAVAPSAVKLPPVVGGPVYRARTARPPAIRAAVNALQARSGAPVAIFLLIDTVEAEHLDDIQDVLPDGVGGFVLTQAAKDVGKRSVVALDKSSSGWTATPVGGTPVQLQHTHRGLAPT